MGETGTIRHRGVVLADAVREVIAELEAIRPHDYSPAAIGALVDEMYGKPWWRAKLIEAVERQLY